MHTFGKIILLSATLWWAAGCNRSYNFFNGSFRHESFNGPVEELSFEPVDIDNLGIKDLWIEDTLLFVAFPRNSEKLLSVYSLTDYRLVYDGLVLLGRGPHECLDINFVSSNTDLSGVKLWLTANGRSKMICIDVTRSISDEKLVIIKEIDLSLIEDSFSLFKVLVQSDTSFVLIKWYTNVQVSMYNPITNKETFVGWLYTTDIDRRNITDFSGDYFFEPNKSILVGGMLFFDQINFYHLNDPQKSFSVSTAKEATHYNLVQPVEAAQRPRYYGGPFGVDGMIVVNYLNGRNMYEEVSVDNNYVHIVDWSGKFLRILHLDRPFFGEAFDKRTGHLYGVDLETWEIIKYKIR